MLVYSVRVELFFFFKQKTAYEIGVRLVGSENVYKRQGLKQDLWGVSGETAKRLPDLRGTVSTITPPAASFPCEEEIPRRSTAKDPGHPGIPGGAVV